MSSNKLFNYYVFVFSKDFEGFSNNINVAVYQDYYYLKKKLEKERKKD